MMNKHDKHCHDHHVSGSGRKFLLVIFFNLAITVAEYIGGIISGSLALISDAGHNLSDVLSLLLGYAGEKISEKGPDKKFSFGFKRFEVIIALTNAFLLIGIGIYIVYEAMMRFIHPAPITIQIMLPVAAIGLAGNLFSMMLLIKDRSRTLNMKAAYLHLLYDTISSIAVIIAGIAIYYTGLVVIDLAISIVIVFMIVGSTLSIIRESIRIFMQASPPHINSDDVYNDIASIEHVGGVHGLHIWSINSTEVFLSCHICINSVTEIIDTDAIIKNVNSMLESKYGIMHTSLQVENNRICSDSGACCR